MATRMGGLVLLFSLAAAALPAASPSAPRVRPPALVLSMPSSPPRASDRDLAGGDAGRRELEGLGGAAVAMDPRTGRVLAVVNPGNALLRAYQPCSVFKIVVAIAGLSEGVITPETTYTCQKGCNLWPGHGAISLRRAPARPRNPDFEWNGRPPRLRRYHRP